MKAPALKTRQRAAPALPPEIEAARLGTRIRTARQVRGMRLQDLADLAGCSVSVLSKIENGKATPSFAMLHNIVSRLGSNLAAFFADADSERQVVIRRQDRARINLKQTKHRGSRIRIESIVPHAADRMLQGNLLTIDSGGESNGAYRHVGEEAGFVLEGFLELTVDGSTHLLAAGDSFCFRSELSHSFRNPGPARTLLIWINTPPTF
jgi:transcriptional regulator with XRE-family HTH domain